MLIVGLIIACIIIVCWHYSRWTTVSAGAVRRDWKVSRGYDNKKNAAELMSRTNAKMIEFMRFLKKKYHIDETADIIAAEGHTHDNVVHMPNDLYNIVDKLLDNYNPDVFYENDPKFSPDTSYTISKGDSMYMCLRNRANPSELVDDDLLFFTHLHESAHIANYRGWGHGDDFWAVFKFILHEAELSGTYKPVDYSKHPAIFCGMDIRYNPLFDDDIPNLWT